MNLEIAFYDTVLLFIIIIIISLTGFLSYGTPSLEPMVHPTTQASSFRL
jgi:hypothetical protein